MRVKHTVLNIAAGLGNQLIITALSFVSRTVFISSLGLEYLGVNALFTSVLAMLSLAEAGIGASIVYHLYKPVADGDKPRVMALMRLYRNTYRIISGAVMLLGLLVLPFLPLIVKETSIEHIELIYSIFLLNTAVPYLFVYKHSYLNVNQKNYIVTMAFSISAIISTSAKIAILYLTENYLLYLAFDSSITIITSLLLAGYANRAYPFLKEKSSVQLDPETKAGFYRNMKAICIANIGNYFIFGVESIMISTFVSLAAVGLYANYKMLLDISRTFMNQIFSGMYHSVGNLVAKEKDAKIYEIYKVTFLLNFWLYSLLAIGMYVLIQPFISVWLGESFRLGDSILLVLVIMFYERGMRNTITTVKTTSGIFVADRYAPLVQAAINLGLSYWLVHWLGFVGIFLGGLISAIAIPFWTTPLLVYREVFKKSLVHYYGRYVVYTIIGLLALGTAHFICGFISDDHYLGLLMQGVAIVSVVNAMYILAFYRTKEFGYLRNLAKSFIGKVVPDRTRVQAATLKTGE
ncbi:lipopolysaccharide biosynthesis protein [Paenibacillus sp. strain BS8-2]